MHLNGNVDSDFANNNKDRKSLTGYVFMLASKSSPISWTTTKQSLVATSTCNSEYVALSAATDETLYLQFLLDSMNLNGTNHNPATLYCDSQGCIDLASFNCHHGKTKHIDIRCHHIRDHVDINIKLKHVAGDNNLADMFTKPLCNKDFEVYYDLLENKHM